MDNRGLSDILKKSKKIIKKEIPKSILNDSTEDIPEVIIVIYDSKVNLDQIDQVVKFKLKKIKDNFSMEKYSVKSKQLSEIYEKDPCKENLENFLDLCSRYIRIERIKNVKYQFMCKGCGNSLEGLKEDSEGIVTCDICNCINTYMKPNNYQRDTEKFHYFFDEDINNFVKILDKFEGKTNLILGPDFFNLLDDYFIGIGFSKGEEIRKMEINEDGKKEGTSKKMLWNALEYLGYSQYYDETSYISNVYWGWELPDISKYRDQLIKDYQVTQNIWNGIKTDYKRSASLGTQFRLYVQLMAVGYPKCDRNDFKIQENIESLRLHNECWKIMCEKANIKYHYVTT